VILTRAEDFMQAAATATGLSDFGDDDFEVGLRVAASDLRESNLPPSMAQRLCDMLSANLEKRLRLREIRRRAPAIAEEIIEGPLVLLGLPRTGTTALVDLLAQDPTARAPLQWETAHLTTPSDKVNWADDPRIAALDHRLRAEAATNPVVALGLHTYGATLPDECNTFMGLNLWSPNVALFGGMPNYAEWLRLGSLRQPYRAHRWVLQQLQYFGPAGRWTLKSPFHLFDLPGLMAEYPGVLLVQTHRDPLQVMASMCGLYATIRGHAEDDPIRARIGAELAALWGMGMQRALAARRDPALEARIFDVSHRAMTQDPMGVLRSVYDHFGLPFSTQVETHAAAWIAAPAQHMSARKFTLAEFDLDQEKIEAAFGDYRERFAGYF
jgi:hypothetical protein